jgi:hypothetical protein
MGAKRPQDRPNWEEILRILSHPNAEPPKRAFPAISVAISAAIARARRIQEKRSLQEAEKAREKERVLGLYINSCETVLARIEPVVDQFNQQFQREKITVIRDPTTLHLKVRSIEFLVRGKSESVF